VEEDYFLVCLKQNLETPPVLRLRAVLAGAAWAQMLNGLPGYRPVAGPGKVLVMTAALPWWRYTRPKAGATAGAGKAGA
jgi:putative molybdopterin biosynthesis protein